MEIHQKILMPNYQKLKTMVKSTIDQRLRLRNFDARHREKIETGAVVKNRKGMGGVGGKGLFAASGKKMASVRKETDAFSATEPKILRKKQNTLPPHLPGHPFHEVEVCRRREVCKAEVTMVPFSDNRADILPRDDLVNIGILPIVTFTTRNGLQSMG